MRVERRISVLGSWFLGNGVRMKTMKGVSRRDARAVAKCNFAGRVIPKCNLGTR